MWCWLLLDSYPIWVIYFSSYFSAMSSGVRGVCHCGANDADIQEMVLIVALWLHQPFTVEHRNTCKRKKKTLIHSKYVFLVFTLFSWIQTIFNISTLIEILNQNNVGRLYFLHILSYLFLEIIYTNKLYQFKKIWCLKQIYSLIFLNKIM